MSRRRTQLITNLYVTDKDIKQLTNGKRIFKRANKHAHCIIPKHAIAQEKINEKIAKQEARVLREQKRLAKLKGQDEAVVVVKLPNGTTYTKRAKYTKKNIEYWNKLKDPKVMMARVKKGDTNVQQISLSNNSGSNQ